MSRFVDLSHLVEQGMPGIRLRLPDGTLKEGGARIGSWITREESAATLGGLAAFEITEMHLVTPIGTYVDSPFNRYPEGRDIADLTLDELILPGVALDLRGSEPERPVGPEALPPGLEVAGCAVLFNFGWDRHWGTPAYRRYPHVDPVLADLLADRGARLLAFDTGNADAADAPAHPLHTAMLAREVLIAENLTGIERLHGHAFRFFAIPIRGRGVGSMTMRAFAEIL